MDSYVVVNGRKFRKGYTTGSCAAAASKAAVIMLNLQKNIDEVEIETPAGVLLKLPVDVEHLNKYSVKCSVIKDGGDDPDITTGLHIFAEARYIEPPEIRINTGEGIGIATFPGLKVAVGEPAINPIPRRMIISEVQKVLKENMGVELLLSVPGGDKVALRTYNPKLGIVGGISILGTTGIVMPMSEEAWKDSLALELNVIAAKGNKDMVFTFGNYGESFAMNELKIDKDKIIKISNFVGFMLDKAEEKGFEEILIIGHLGKLVKVAAGIFHTHSRVADARMEIMAAYAALEGASKEIVAEIFDCKTTDAAAKIIIDNNLSKVFERIAENAAKRCSEYTFGKIKVRAVLFNEDHHLLASTFPI